MQAVTAAFLSAVQNSHTAVTSVELWANNTFVRYLYPVAGSVEVDARRAVRRSASITLLDEDGTLNPNLPSSVLTPYGSEVRMYRGVRFPDGTTEYAALGVFRIVGVDVSRGDSGLQLGVQLEDRARVVQQARYSTPYTVAASTNYGTAIQALVARAYPSAETNVAATTYSSPATGAKVLGLEASTDPWSDILGIAESIGEEAYFAADGTFTTTPIPSLSNSTAQVTFTEGGGSTLLDVSYNIGTADVYNGIIAKAEGSHLTTPLESRVWDDDTSSPTRRTGPLGERPYEWSSSWVASQAQLDDAAAALLDTVRGMPVSFSVVPNPALDVRDVVRITSTTMGIDSAVMIDTLSIPLSPADSMQVTGRMRGY
jgi:hypothetical protein